MPNIHLMYANLEPKVAKYDFLGLKGFYSFIFLKKFCLAAKMCNANLQIHFIIFVPPS